MTDRTERKKACMWMIRHYNELSDGVWDLYPDIVDAYLVYDHYMMAIEQWFKKLEDICNENIKYN